MEAAHANSMENFSFFVAGSMSPPNWIFNEMFSVLTRFTTALLATQAGVPGETINKIGAWYTVSRLAFALGYIFIESESLSFLRSIAWWSGSLGCISALILAGEKLRG